MSVYAFMIRKRRNATSVHIEQHEFSTGDDLSRYHNKKLKLVFENASRSEYWNRLFREHGVDIESRNSLKELRKLPLTEKRDLRDCQEEVALSAHDKITLTTSGSTGTGFIFNTTAYAESASRYFAERYWRRFGVGSPMWWASFAGRVVVPLTQQNPPFWRSSYFSRQVFFSNYHLSSTTIRAYIDHLNKIQPMWLHGYPSFLGLLASLAKEQGIHLSYRPYAVTLSSENVSESQLKELKEFFQTSVAQNYGQTEGVAIFTECEQGKLHIDEEFSYVELIPVDGQEGKYEVVGTSFF
ncbi:MAG: hypothetical protein MPJ24_10305 [Pirellulaceae bacterium]|nr:hypothetical protein [Pirellulaceae bacterium]